MTIRTVLINEINQMILATNYFEANEFIINSTRNNDKYVLQIQYQFDSAYKFIAWIPNQKSKDKDSYSPDYQISATVSPGEIGETEHFYYVGRSKLFDGIKEWLIRVRDELIAVPAHRQVVEQKEQLEDILTQFPNLDSDNYFSQEEVEELKKRLEEMEAKIAENIRNTVTDQKEQKERLEKLENEIKALKVKLTSHKKRAWAGAIGARLIQWAQDPIHRKVLKSGGQEAKTLLLSAGETQEDVSSVSSSS